MQKRKIIYEILVILAASGIILSLLFGPGTDTPSVTIYTAFFGLALLLTEYLWVRQTVLLKGRVIDAKWVVTSLVILTVTIIPQLLCLIIAAFLWSILLPAAGIAILVLLYKLFRTNSAPSRSKK